MKKTIKIFLILFLFLSIYNNIDCDENNSLCTIIQPFKIYYESFDIHVMLFFNNHPEYESVEAFIKKSNDMLFIRAIITRHNQSQIDFINDKIIAEKIKQENTNREIYYTPINYQEKKENQNVRIILQFNSHKNESIYFDFITAGEPDEKYAGLIDPGSHSFNTSLPVMYSELNTLAGEDSKIKINNTEYEIPVKISQPPYFIGMEGYYSEGYNLGVILASDEQIKLIQYPKNIQKNEKWIYNQENKNIVYTIKDIKKNEIRVENDTETIILERKNNSLGITKIIYNSPEKKEFIIEFSSSIPLSINNNEKSKLNGKFKISINNHKDIISGIFKTIKNENSLKITLIPSNPSWAKKRQINININHKDSIFIVTRKIGL